MTAHVATAHEIETFGGRFVDTSNPSVETIALEDIAHALANICRYGGHCATFYSVAEHAVFVSKRLERKGHPRDIQIAGLHHDDAEAYLGDIPRPIKPLLGNAYKRMTADMDEAIGAALNIEPSGFHDPLVKDADNWALFVEAKYLLPSGGKHWWNGEQGADSWGLPPQPTRIVTPDYWRGGLTPAEAERLFLRRHAELTGEGRRSRNNDPFGDER
jgi:hypothetical protein